jgi:hypothetical protein
MPGEYYTKILILVTNIFSILLDCWYFFKKTVIIQVHISLLIGIERHYTGSAFMQNLNLFKQSKYTQPYKLMHTYLYIRT